MSLFSCQAERRAKLEGGSPPDAAASWRHHELFPQVHRETLVCYVQHQGAMHGANEPCSNPSVVQKPMGWLPEAGPPG